MSSIYTVEAWSASDSYRKHAVVQYNNLYYYALSDLSAGQSNPSASLGSFWGGYLTYQGETKPNFLWVPSFNSTVNNQPKVNSIQFGNGYVQRSRAGLNNLLLTVDYVFDQRNSNEAKAIIHFLNEREGVESFFFTPPEPYNEVKKFICKTFPHTEIFYDNHSIRATFEEVLT